MTIFKSLLLFGVFLSSFVHANATPRDDYFTQFIFRIEGDCSNKSLMKFHDLGSYNFTSLGKDGMGRDTFAGLTLNLFSDGTYWAEYQEYALIDASNPNHYKYTRLFLQQISGSWNVANDQLNVENLGVGVASAKNHGTDKIDFTFAKVLHDGRILGSISLLTKIETNQGPYGESIEQYCKP